jgi:hypothetical protein
MSVDDFFSNLGDILDQQFYTGENKNKSAQLGSFANKYDRSAQRSYLEQGYFRNHSVDNVPKQLEIMAQAPEATVLVKKRAFASLAENFRPDLMDKDEALFLKATKLLFKNKCAQISAFERLTKLAQVSTQIGEVDYHLLPILFGATDALSSLGIGLGKFQDTINRVREILAFNTDRQYTTWQMNPTDNFKNSFGEGTGVIEFNTMMSFSTTTALSLGKGSVNLSFSDPYNIMNITNNDIEAAISDSTNKFYSLKGFNVLNSVAQDTLDLQKTQFNQLRASRGVYSIRFIVEPETFVGKRVRALIDGIGFEINFQASSITNLFSSTSSSAIDPSALVGSDEIGDQGLTPEEQGLFLNIASSIYNNLSLKMNSRRQALSDNVEQNLQANNLRKKMQLHYRGKRIIQPMDTVSIFINSKKQVDTKVTSGLQSALSGLKLMQGISNLSQNINDNLNAYKGYSIEKTIFVGADFPNPLWLALRSQFVADKQGACVFSGFIKNVISRYSQDGSYEVSATGVDNGGYFEKGIINIKPSLDVHNGALFDPLTPFKQHYDVAGGETDAIAGKDPELLDENKAIFKSAFVKVKNGPLAGSIPSEQGYFNNTNSTSPVAAGAKSRTPFYDPEGFVYRWKEGIATHVLSRTGEATSTNKAGISVSNEPFAGQDIMNVISLMITGEPYNYATFYKATTQFNTMSRDPLTKQDSAASYFRGLRSELKNRNAIYGDFIPFKKLTMDEASFEKIIGSQLRITGQDAELQDKIAERAKFADKLAFAPDAIAAQIKSKLQDLDFEIQIISTNIFKELNRTDNPPMSIVGNDVSYETDDTLSVNGTKLNDTARVELRRKINFLTRRLAWKVRANEDQNLFIVDDTYDKDYDIQQFEKSIAQNFSIYKSEYTTAAEQIRGASDKLKLEVFCNTQGHIEVRNPKYNRMPSSVFDKMLKQKNELGIQLFPQFLEDLFTTQLSDIYKQLSIIEDRIRLYGFILSGRNDSECEKIINSLSGDTQRYNDGSFSFLSSSVSGEVNENINVVINKADPETLTDIVQKLDSQSNLNIFSTVARAKFIQSGSQPPSTVSGRSFLPLEQLQSYAAVNDRFIIVSARVFKKTGQAFDLAQEFGVDQNTIVKTKSSSVATLQVSNKIAALLSDRQKAIKTAASALKNIQEGASLNSKDGGSKLLFPQSSGGNKIPSALEHMIEDESYDDLGVGSKTRYVLKNKDIISYQVAEEMPDFTAINVVGRFGDLFISNSQLPSDLNAFPGTDGSSLSTVSAVDYDLWRMYGISMPQTVDAPFLENPETQLAPYAAAILTQARKSIHQGSIDIVGNEFQQPGEVVYVENQDMLFYVDSVNHTFAYGQTFKTSIAVKYGHTPGEYIPTPMDIIGKVLYKNNKNLYKLDNRRQGTVFKQENLGAVAVNLSNLFGDVDIFTNFFGDVNRSVMDQIIKSAGTLLSQQTNDVKPILELRYYNNAKVSGVNEVNFELESIAQKLINYLVGGVEFEGSDLPSIGLGSKKDNKRLMTFSSTGQIVKRAVDGDPSIDGEFRYPSRRAFYLAKEAVAKVISGSTHPTQDQIDKAIYNYVIDFWVYFENVKK